MAEKDIKKDHLKPWYRNQQGKDFIMYGGLLAEFHRLCDEWMAEHPNETDQRGIAVTIIQIPHADNGQSAVSTATVKMANGTEYTEIGDADPTNTNKLIANAKIRMSATRAKGRAFRDATNISTTMYEELSTADVPDDDDAPQGAAANDDDGFVEEAAARLKSASPPATAVQLKKIKDLAEQLGEKITIPGDLDQGGAQAMLARLQVKVDTNGVDKKTVYKRITDKIPEYARKSGTDQDVVVATVKGIAGIKTARLGEAPLDQLVKAEKALDNMLAEAS